MKEPIPVPIFVDLSVVAENERIRIKAQNDETFKSEASDKKMK